MLDGKKSQAELVERHRDSAFKKELARAHGVHAETVRAITRRHAHRA
jgi:hypothetical protein